MTVRSHEFEADLEVHRKSDVVDGVAVLELRHPAGVALPQWTPGSHIDVVLQPDLVRQYSLCGDPSDPGCWRIAVLREPDGRGGSQYVHDKLDVGDSVRVRGPRNNFELRDAPRYIFIAGGIGITPMLPMVAAAHAAGSDWTLTYGGRRRGSMAFVDELTTLYPDSVEVCAQDVSGRPDLSAILGTPLPDTLVYCCGPAGLLDAVAERCEQWPAGTLHVERFAARELGAPVLDEPFEVELALSGTTVTVPPGTSILEAVTAAGVQVLSSCQEGTCGTCETSVLGGVVEHRDSLLTDEERAADDTMMICVSRAACPRLVLDL
ncbi:2Fe-2S iron-sulfur cluster-binding protein [Rhodococcus sp. TAF43]|uniref:PDR/VanB family oxidoreductase n=1 Tax=unclassified Rhodococcus (in: high G+C Gram-positive bacteria) TaxID=192944 RepID=UPI0015835A32|nr:PDR/VanB family oxidoreductase [Rhodococcus sp. W8901]QKT10471.1 oxidoreductase [Rhodococcus sp. W8901]